MTAAIKLPDPERINDTPREDVYREYDRRKAGLWLRYGECGEYRRRLEELQRELGI